MKNVCYWGYYLLLTSGGRGGLSDSDDDDATAAPRRRSSQLEINLSFADAQSVITGDNVADLQRRSESSADDST